MVFKLFSHLLTRLSRETTKSGHNFRKWIELFPGGFSLFLSKKMKWLKMKSLQLLIPSLIIFVKDVRKSNVSDEKGINPKLWF